jgi:general secretion pathway protein G
MKAIRARGKRRMRGFTLIEIMVVVVIIGLLAAMVVPNLMENLSQAEVTAAKHDIKAIDDSILMFRMQHHRYPTEDEGLAILTGEPVPGSDIEPARLTEILKSVPKDPWSREYFYRIPGEHGAYDIFSLGADGEEGGEDSDADIGNWEEDDR